MPAKIVKSQDVVNSSNIKKVAYTEDNSLIVTFLKGTEYIYKGVPEETYDNMAKSESAGKFLNAFIKGKFEYVQLPAMSPDVKS